LYVAARNTPFSPALTPVLAQGFCSISATSRPPEPFFKPGPIRPDSRRRRTEDVQVGGNVVNPMTFSRSSARMRSPLRNVHGPLEMVKPWNTKGVQGVYRFLGRVWRLSWMNPKKLTTEFEQGGRRPAKTPNKAIARAVESDKIDQSSRSKMFRPRPCQAQDAFHAWPLPKKVTAELAWMRLQHSSIPAR